MKTNVKDKRVGKYGQQELDDNTKGENSYKCTKCGNDHSGYIRCELKT